MIKDLDVYHENVPGDYYDKAIKHNILQRFWHRRRFKEVKCFLDSIQTERILDVGCHGGSFTYEIFKQFPRSSIYGIDISSEAIKFAKKKYYPKIHFQIGRAESIPFPRGSFDLVTCLEVMEHVDNPLKVIQEIKRVLKKEGHFIVLVPTENMLFKIIWFFWSRFGPGKIWQHTHVQKFTDHSLDNILAKAGLKIVNRKVFILGMLLLLYVRKR